jgi:hypothetical protein
VTGREDHGVRRYGSLGYNPSYLGNTGRRIVQDWSGKKSSRLYLKNKSKTKRAQMVEMSSILSTGGKNK